MSKPKALHKEGTAQVSWLGDGKAKAQGRGMG